MSRQRTFQPEVIPYRRGDKWGFADRTRKIIVEPIYDQTFPFYLPDLARVTLDDKSGFVNREGKVVVPIVYDDVGDLDGGLVARGGVVYLVKNDRIGLMTPDGTVLVPAECDSPDEADERAAELGFHGAVIPLEAPNTMDSEVLATLNELGRFQDGVAPFRIKNQWGLIDQNGAMLAEPQYDEIEEPENRYWPFRQGARWGLLDARGQQVLAADFDEARGFSEGHAACRQGSKWGAVGTDGAWIYPPRFEELGELREGLAAAQVDGRFGFVDADGRVVIEPRFEAVFDFWNGVCGIYDDGMLRFIDRSGAPADEHHYRPIHPPLEGERSHVELDGKWGIVGADGKVVVPIIYDPPRAMGQVIGEFTAGLTPIKHGALLGFADETGHEVVPPKYVTVDLFTEERAVVSVLDPKLSRGTTPEDLEATGSISGVFLFGFIDREGQEVVPPKYRIARRFDYGLAFVETVDMAWGYIDHDGREYFDG